MTKLDKDEEAVAKIEQEIEGRVSSLVVSFLSFDSRQSIKNLKCHPT